MEKYIPLSEASAGRTVSILRVSDEDTAVLNHLGERGLVPGRLLIVEEVRTLDGVVTVRDESGREHTLGEGLARSIFVGDLPNPS